MLSFACGFDVVEYLERAGARWGAWKVGCQALHRHPEKNIGGQGKLFCAVLLPCRDAIYRLPQTSDNRRISLKRQLERKLIGHKKYINQYGEDMPEISNWRWSSAKATEVGHER